MKQLIAVILILLVLLGLVIGFLLLDVDQTATAIYELLGPISSSEAETQTRPETEPTTSSRASSETEPSRETEPTPPGEIDEGKYIYQHIGETEQAMYLRMFEALSAFEPGIELSEEEQRDFESGDLLSVFNFILDDSPELFWVDSEITVSTLTSGEQTAATEVRFSYLFSEEESAGVQKEIDAYEERCLEGLAADAPLFDKILHVYEYIINNTEYDLNARYNQNLLSVALYGESVCKGYARMTQYLLGRLGIPCTTVNGYAGEPHSWNLVNADGDYYYLDSTWGDPQKLAADGEEQGSFISYHYFMITEKELAYTHDIEEAYPYPPCDSTALGYYNYTDRFFDTYDYDAVAALMQRDFLSGGNLSTMKFATDEAYQTALASLIDNSEAHQILQNVEAYQQNDYSFSYSSDDDFRILDFMV